MTDNHSEASRLERLVEAGIHLNAENTLKGVLDVVASYARYVIEAEYSAVGIAGPDGMIEHFTTSGVNPDLVERMGPPPTGKGVLGLLINESKAIRLANISDHPSAVGFPANHPMMSSFLGVPVIGKVGPIGNLYLTNKIGSDEFTKEDEHVANMFAAQAGVAVQNARLLEETTRLLEEVRVLHASREKFFATINHEMRNALTGVHGWTELLLRKLGSDAPKSALEILEASENTLALLEDLLLLNKLDVKKIGVSIKETEIGQLLREAVSELRRAADEKQVKIDLQIPSERCGCQTDGAKVQRILFNLVASSVRHGVREGEVRIVLWLENTTYFVTVANDGRGFDQELLPRIFDDYVQGDSSLERGTGLALPLARRLARLIGGEVRITSEPNKGSTYTFELPIRPTH